MNQLIPVSIKMFYVYEFDYAKTKILLKKFLKNTFLNAKK